LLADATPARPHLVSRAVIPNRCRTPFFILAFAAGASSSAA
jgi:hypothetical protein